LTATTAAVLTAAACTERPGSTATTTATVKADTIYRGGTIVTMVDDRREAQALAVAGGRILAVGTEQDVLATQGPDTDVVDLAGRTLLPSFIDSHGHFISAAQVLMWANVQGVPAGPITKMADIVPVLQKHVATLAPKTGGLKPGDWIVGYGYDRSNLAEQRELTVDDLDPAFPDNPVMLIHSSMHGAVLNSAALARIGYDADTPTPAGGLIVRKPGTTVPAGLIMETAFLPIIDNMPQPGEREMLDRLDKAQQIYARVGVTTCQEGATHAKDLRFLRKAAEEGLLYLDVVSLPFMLDIPELAKDFEPGFSGAPMQLPDRARDAFGQYNNHLKLQGIKFVLDGSPQGKTAYWTQPLLTPGPGGEPNWRGQPVMPPEEINKALAEVYGTGIQVFCHANGDAAIDMAIDGMRKAGARAADDQRTVVIHSQCMRPDQLDHYAELGFTPSFFTAHTFYWGDEHLANLGPQRAAFMSPMASAFAKGLHCSNHTDYVVTPMEPMRVMWSSVKRTSRSGKVLGPDERIDIWQALRSQTIEAAWQLFEEDRKGTLEQGKLADLVILDANPLVAETDSLLDIRVLETVKEGKTVYRSER
jgi:predicted amidohydrolase YtcJ